MTPFGSDAESRYAALIGDLVRSREAPDRAAVQKILLARFRALNRSLGGETLAAPLAFTAGDEFQALLRQPEAAVAIAVDLAESLHPQQIAFGLGWGEVSTPPPPAATAAALDGPCFHRARAALQRASREGRWLVAAGFGEPEDRVVSALFRLMGSLRRGWTEKQAQYVHAARSGLQKDVARRFGVSPSVVSESLRAACFDSVRESEEAASAVLSRFGKITESGRNSVILPNSSPPSSAARSRPKKRDRR